MIAAAVFVFVNLRLKQINLPVTLSDVKKKKHFFSDRVFFA